MPRSGSSHWLTVAARLVLATSCGCAPLAELRPASGSMPGNSFELGGGVVRLGERPYVTESPATTGQLWFSGDASKLVTLTAISAFDTSAATVGGAVRLNALRFDRFAAGTEAQAGGGWLAAVVPLAVRVVSESWIYASPRLGTLGRHPSFGLPAGVSIPLGSQLAVRGEAQVSWEDFKYYNRRIHLGLGVAYQW